MMMLKITETNFLNYAILLVVFAMCALAYLVTRKKIIALENAPLSETLIVLAKSGAYSIVQKESDFEHDKERGISPTTNVFKIKTESIAQVEVERCFQIIKKEGFDKKIRYRIELLQLRNVTVRKKKLVKVA